jgi:CheY-like chemotaxis protein
VPHAARLLLIDDDAAVRRCLSDVLTAAGYHVVAASSATEGLRAIASEPFAAVLCDEHLGDGRGTDVLRYLVGLKPALGARFFLITGSDADGGDERVRAFAAARPDRRLQKPFRNEELLEALAKALAPASRPPARV